jgi:hypothetical protein
MITFGQIPTYQSDDKFELAVSDDKRALTLTFSDLQTAVGGSKSAAPISTRMFSLVVPLEGDDKNVEIEFGVSSSIATLDDATATLVCSVNGQSTVADFPANSDESFVQQLKFTCQSPSECRLCVVLLVGRGSKNSKAEAFLNVTAIDAEILPRPR